MTYLEFTCLKLDFKHAYRQTFRDIFKPDNGLGQGLEFNDGNSFLNKVLIFT